MFSRAAPSIRASFQVAGGVGDSVGGGKGRELRPQSGCGHLQAAVGQDLDRIGQRLAGKRVGPAGSRAPGGAWEFGLVFFSACRYLTAGRNAARDSQRMGRIE